MLRHPIYLAVCLFTVGYLALAGPRGWSFFHSISPGRGARGAFGSSFNHK
jgi:hypothetical protein